MNDGKFVNDEIVNNLIKNIVFDSQKKSCTAGNTLLR